MKNAENRFLRFFPGAGYLLGSVITMVIAISLFVWLENITISISAGVPIGTAMGILLEQRFRGEDRSYAEHGRPVLLGLLTLGVLLLLAIFILTTTVW